MSIWVLQPYSQKGMLYYYNGLQFYLPAWFFSTEKQKVNPEIILYPLQFSSVCHENRCAWQLEIYCFKLYTIQCLRKNYSHPAQLHSPQKKFTSLSHPGGKLINTSLPPPWTAPLLSHTHLKVLIPPTGHKTNTNEYACNMIGAHERDLKLADIGAWQWLWSCTFKQEQLEKWRVWGDTSGMGGWVSRVCESGLLRYVKLLFWLLYPWFTPLDGRNC